MVRNHRRNQDGSRYYTREQSLRRAVLAGITFGAFPLDWRHADDASSWTRVQDVISRYEKEHDGNE